MARYTVNDLYEVGLDLRASYAHVSLRRDGKVVSRGYLAQRPHGGWYLWTPRGDYEIGGDDIVENNV